MNFLLSKQLSLDPIYDPQNLSFNNNNDYSSQYKKEELADAAPKESVNLSLDEGGLIDIPPKPPVKVDKEEVKEGKGIKILTPNKLLIRLPILLAH